MTAVFIIVFTALLIVLAVLYRTLFPFLHQTKMRKRLSKDGIEAEAVLLNVEATGIYINNLPQIKLQLRVYPEAGRNFITESFELLSYLDIGQIHIGGSLLVKYNPANTKEVMVVWQGLTAPYPF